MISFWIAISLVSFFCIVYVWFVASAQINSETTSDEFSDSRWIFLLPTLVICLSPILYFSWNSYTQQKDWMKVQDKTQLMLTTGDISQVEMNMQELMLGLRTNAFQNPENGKIWFELGKAYINLQMNDIALASMQRAIQLEQNPDWIVSTAQLLTSSTESQEFQRAAEMLEQVLLQYPEHQNALLSLGFTQIKLGRYSQAIDSWQKLLTIDSFPENSKSLILQQIEKAKQLISKP